MSDAQLGLRRAGARHDVQRGRLRQRRDLARVGRGVALPSRERIDGDVADLGMVAVADGDERRFRRHDRPGVERPNIVDGDRRKRRFAADRRMPVRVVAVQELDERPVGDRTRQVAELHEPMKPKLPDACEIGIGQARARGHVGHQRERAADKAAQHHDAQRRGVGSDVGVELRADLCQCLVHLDGRPAAASLVEHVHGDRRQAVLAGTIVCRSAANEQDARYGRHGRMPRRPDAKPAWQNRFFDRRKNERAAGPRRGKTRTVGLERASHHETTVGIESAAADCGGARLSVGAVAAESQDGRRHRRLSRAGQLRSGSCLARGREQRSDQRDR